MSRTTQRAVTYRKRTNRGRTETRTIIVIIKQLNTAAHDEPKIPQRQLMMLMNKSMPINTIVFLQWTETCTTTHLQKRTYSPLYGPMPACPELLEGLEIEMQPYFSLIACSRSHTGQPLAPLPSKHEKRSSPNPCESQHRTRGLE